MNDSVVFSFMKLIENCFPFSVGLFVCDHVLTLTHTHMKMKIGKKPLRPSQTKKRKLLLYTSFRKLFCFFYICGRYCIVPVIKFISMVSIQCGKGYNTHKYKSFGPFSWVNFFFRPNCVYTLFIIIIIRGLCRRRRLCHYQLCLCRNHNHNDHQYDSYRTSHRYRCAPGEVNNDNQDDDKDSIDTKYHCK